MARQRWTNQEIAVVIFYASRRVSHQACSDLVSLKCGTTRTVTSVRSKVLSLRSEHPQLEKPWRLEQVNVWLQGLQGVDLNLLTFNDETIEIISQVRLCDITDPGH